MARKSEGLEVFLRLVDIMSPALKKAGMNVKAFEKQVESTKRELGGMDAAQNRVAKSTDRLSKKAVAGSAVWSKFAKALPVLKMASIASAIRDLVPMVSSLGAAAIAATGATAPLMGLYAGVPALALAFMSAKGIITSAFKGIGDAIGMIVSGTEDAEKMAAALKGAAPEAIAFARSMRKLTKPVKELRKGIQGKFFAQFTQSGEKLAGMLIALTPAIQRMAEATGRAVSKLVDLFTGATFQRQLPQVLDTNSMLIEVLGTVIGNLAEAAIRWHILLRPFFRGFGDLLIQFSNNAREFTTKNGRGITHFFEKTLEVAQIAGPILMNWLGGIIKFFGIAARASGDAFGGSLLTSSKNFVDMIARNEGKITTFFQEMGSLLPDVFGMLKALLKTLFGEDGFGRGIDSTRTLLQYMTTTLLPNLATAIKNIPVEWTMLLARSLNVMVLAFDAIPLGVVVRVAEVFLWFAEAVIKFVEKTGTGGFLAVVAGMNMGMSTLNRTMNLLVPGWDRLAVSMKDAVLKSRLWVTVSTEVGGRLLYLKDAVFTLVGGLAKKAAAWVVLTATQVAAAYTTGGLTAAMAALNVALWANPVGLLVAAVVILIGVFVIAYNKSEKFRNIIQSLFGWFINLYAKVFDFLKNLDVLGGMIGWVRDKFESWKLGIQSIVGWLRELKSTAIDAARAVGDFMTGRSGGLAGRAVSWVNPFGDTATSKASSGGAVSANLGRTLSTHSSIDAGIPGHRVITNAMHGGFSGSDHHSGKALDIIGSGLNTYARKVKEMGGFAEHHGSGESRHLHVAMGDTARPRATPAGTGGGGVGVTLQLNGPLIGTVVANNEMDVTRAVNRGIESWIREREERR